MDLKKIGLGSILAGKINHIPKIGDSFSKFRTFSQLAKVGNVFVKLAYHLACPFELQNQ